MTVLSEHIPEDGGGGVVAVIFEADEFSACDQFVVQLVVGAARNADAGQVALHIGAENRDAGIGKALRENLQRDGLAGAGCARHEAMAVGHFQ